MNWMVNTFFFFFLLGYPLPRLAWFTLEDKSKQLVDSSFENIGNSTQNTLFIKTLERTHFGKTFTCFASNNNATQPVATNVTIDMRRKFINVKLIFTGPFHFIVSLM